MTSVDTYPTSRYTCDFKDCGKSFSRSDHLSRHQLNHTAVRRKCSWPTCDKSFTRQDVYRKHYKQKHELPPEPYKVKKPDSKPIRFVYMGETPKKVEDQVQKTVDLKKELKLETYSKSASELRQSTPEPVPSIDVSPETSYEEFSEKIGGERGDEVMDFSIQDLVSSNEMIKWLFGGIESNVSDTSSVNDYLSVSPTEESFPELGAFEYPLPAMTPLTYDESFSKAIGFPFSTDQMLVDDEVKANLAEYLDLMKLQSNEMLQHYVENYWKFYHHQFPILNFPSFSTKSSHPILLISMILMGSFIASTTNREALKFSDSIAEPLRLVIYNSKDFKPPPKLWVVQSLLLLESYEICCSSRDLHERANLHRGISIQMLKRSPMFGGNPWHSSSDDIVRDSISPFSTREAWQKWIDEESMKRCALGTFYLEVLHAVVFGHDMNIGLHEVKPTLPCNEEFWKTGLLPDKGLQGNVTLLAAIKSILHRKPIKVHGFGKSILLSGLIALSFEIKDREFEFSLPELQSIKQLWQKRINDAFRVWDLNFSSSQSEKMWLETYSIPLRDLYESYTQIKHYDFMVYVGAPGRMNVSISEKEFEVVTSRVIDWVNSCHGRRAIILIYSYFCRLLFDGIKPLTYNPKEDRCLYRKQMISHMLVILWCWCYYSSGPESHSLKWNKDSYHHISNIEDGHSYLNRIKNELTILASKEFNKENVNKNIDLFADVLSFVPGKQNIVGLLRLFRNQYIDDLSAIAREHAKLLEHCMNRSLGSGKKVCDNMFE